MAILLNEILEYVIYKTIIHFTANKEKIGRCWEKVRNTIRQASRKLGKLFEVF